LIAKEAFMFIVVEPGLNGIHDVIDGMLVC